MTSNTMDVITVIASFTVAAAFITVGLLHLAGIGIQKGAPRNKAVPSLLFGAGIVLITLARIPKTDRTLFDALLLPPGMLLVLAGAYLLWRTR